MEGREGAGEKYRDRAASGEVRGVPGGQTGSVAIRDYCRARCATYEQSEGDCDRGDERRTGRDVCSATEHELARGQALVVRRAEFVVGGARAAALHRVCARANRQDQGVDGGDEQGISLYPRGPAADRRRTREDSGERDAELARLAGDD